MRKNKHQDESADEVIWKEFQRSCLKNASIINYKFSLEQYTNRKYQQRNTGYKTLQVEIVELKNKITEKKVGWTQQQSSENYQRIWGLNKRIQPILTIERKYTGNKKDKKSLRGTCRII